MSVSSIKYLNQDYGLILEMMQYRAIVTVDGEYETAAKLWNGANLNDLHDYSPGNIEEAKQVKITGGGKMRIFQGVKCGCRCG